jgi:hypothetical protein
MIGIAEDCVAECCARWRLQTTMKLGGLRVLIGFRNPRLNFLDSGASLLRHPSIDLPPELLRSIERRRAKAE